MRSPKGQAIGVGEAAPGLSNGKAWAVFREGQLTHVSQTLRRAGRVTVLQRAYLPIRAVRHLGRLQIQSRDDKQPIRRLRRAVALFQQKAMR